MIGPRIPGRALLPFVLHGLAREVDAALGVLLHTSLDLPDFLPRALALLEPWQVVRALAAWGLGGAALLAACAARRRAGQGAAEAAASLASAFLPLLLRPALTLIALASLALRPTYPYGFTLPVALTQDWAPVQDLAAFAAVAVSLAGRPRLAAPRPAEVFFMAFVAYALLVPGWARHWDGHPGNEPKYLRMALALGHRLSLDVDGIDAAMEELPVEPFSATAPRALRLLARESWRLVGSLPVSLSEQAVAPSRVARQTIRGKDGGVFHVLAPGPALLLAPTLRLDRELNLRGGTPGRLAVTLLAWNGLAAALVAALFLLLRDATGRPGLSAVVAGFFALMPPFAFYPFQFYPEMPGALVLALAMRELAFGARRDTTTLLRLGLLLATLPWLHQKFLPVWALLAALAAVQAIDRLVALPALLALAVPQAVTLFLFGLYNFAITGSARPDAMFLAWGPAGVTTAHFGQGFLGLLVDRRYGILPYAPAYLLAGGGLLLATRGAARLRGLLPVAAVYYLTVSAADDWHGAVSNLGRYFMPVAPYVVALAGVALAAPAGRAAAALALALAAWTGLAARLLWLDPHAANDASLLLARSAFADGSVYVPDLFIKSFAEGAPGLFARLACWLGLALLVAAVLRHAARSEAALSPARALAWLAAFLLAAGALLERWPSAHGAPRFADALELRPGTVVFVSGNAAVDRGAIRAGPGELEVLVRSRANVAQLTLIAAGSGSVAVPRRPPVAAQPSGTWAALPVDPLVRLEGRRGIRETLYRQRLRVTADQPLILRLALGE